MKLKLTRSEQETYLDQLETLKAELHKIQRSDLSQQKKQELIQVIQQVFQELKKQNKSLF